MYIIVGFGGVLYIRGLTNASLENIGGYLFLLIFISSWVPDAGAYFVGVNFGKHKLIPDVSPKKSVEGALGGIAASIVSFMIYTLIVNIAFDAKLHFGLMILASIVLAVASMIGDLIALLQSPAKNVVSALQSGGGKLAGIVKTLSEKAE